ncbi:long-chain fatty acid--CoA ligase [Frankia sp. AiPa1]|uniref:acyl-CoA synthetase n=1 Tax=Frankia sp. AiPa1 TaxID=573492 RepID=UPI00202B5974|nr:long-chain fatty acid--CoA ligase [Frankia sp. AiPa1]MCL9760040.1 long-chain fatty acid--CoA ligase [Frankia sp. AiPa1]
MSTADMNWVGVLEHHAARTPDRPFAVQDGDVVSYRGALDRAAAIAAGLRVRGVAAGDVVALLAHNSIDFLTTIFAANHLGAVVMPLNWRLAAPELAYILEHAQARVLVADAELAALGADAARALPALDRVLIGRQDRAGWVRLDDVADGTAPPVERAPAAGDDLQRLMYTSGTTGRPKGVMITHANLAWKNYAHTAEFGLTGADIGLACGPLYHVGALDLVTTSIISAGGSTHVHPVFDAARVVDDIESARITVVWLAPAMVRAILDLPGIETRDLSSVRLLIGGGEKMPLPLIDRIERIFPSAWFADAYGLTETVSGDTFLDAASIRAKRGSVGRTCLYLELDIWDAQGRPLPAGESGEIVLRGPKVFRGYWRDPAATERAFAGGWFHTGDIGVRDADGYVFIVDRLKDMILSGGENIAGSEVERVLYEHADVREAAVVGRPDPRWGEVPVAFVALRPGSGVAEQELLEHCRGQLARFKVPRAVTFVDALPRNPSGKILKRELRALIDQPDGQPV